MHFHRIRDTTRPHHRPRVLIVVQNLPVPLDRRVWLECQALRDAGYLVSVICPQGPGDPSFEVVEGVALYKYPCPPQAEGALGYVVEFTYAWLWTALLSVRVRRQRGFDILQACNPPDTYWALARLWKWRGVRFVFDHHDLNPELFLSRFGSPTGLLRKMELTGLRTLERCTFRTADHVIATNESYKEIAVRRGGLTQEDVTVVRSGPDTGRMRPVYPTQDLRKGAEHLLVYLGIMGPQDGVENALFMMDELIHRRGRRDVRAVLLGFGDRLEHLRRMSTDMGLDHWVEFTGRADADTIAAYLSAADVGLGPDPKTPLNDVSTMNKTMEYMAYALPSVAFDLVETRVTAGDCVLLVPDGDILAFADAVERLLDEPDLRAEMGVRARRRVAEKLDWVPQRLAYLRAIGSVQAGAALDQAPTLLVAEPAPPEGCAYVPLDDEIELRRFVRYRCAGVREQDQLTELA